MGSGINVEIVADLGRLQRLMRMLEGQPVRILYDGTEYGVYQEFGFTHAGSGKHVAARPFISPAAELARKELDKGWPQVIEKQLMSAEDFVGKVADDAERVAKDAAPYRTGKLKNSIGVCKPDDFRPRGQ